jgi:hypothetical protein
MRAMTVTSWVREREDNRADAAREEMDDESDGRKYMS